MKSIKLTVLFFFILGSINLFAKSAHSYTASKYEILQVAKKEIFQLVKKGKIPKTWLKADLLKFEKKSIARRLHYITTFRNKKVKDIEKNTIYFAIDKFGELRTMSYKYKELF